MSSVLKALAIVGCAFLAYATPARAQDDSLALAVKATYLYKLAPFIDWPSEADSERLDESRTFDICVVGDDPFGAVLDNAVAGQSVRAQQIKVRRFPSTQGGAGGCKILYVAGSRIQSVAAALEKTKGSPVLTVTDGGRITAVQKPETQGIVHFVEESGRIKFRIDNVAAEENGLVISSKLLDLAVSVRTRSGGSSLE